KVHIATPTTLITMLRTAQYAWQQAALAENARVVFDLGRELYNRLAGLGGPRRLNELGVTGAELATPTAVEETTRTLSAPEFVASEPAGIESGGPAELGPAVHGVDETGPGEIAHRVSLVRAAR